MSVNKQSTGRDLSEIDEDAPDLSESPWLEKLASAPVRVGRPRSEKTKVSTTIRLDPEVIEAFRRNGPGWQSQINSALKEWLASRNK